MADEATQQTRLLTRLRITLGQQRARAKNQLQAVLHQEGFLKPVADLFGKQGRAWLAGVALSPAGRVVVEVWLKMVDQMDAAIAEQMRALERMARRRCAGEVAADGAGDRGIFGDGDPGRGGRDRTVRDQAGAGQLCRADAVRCASRRASASAAGSAIMGRNAALDHAAGGAGGGPMLAGRESLVSAAEAAKTSTGGADRTGTQAAHRRLGAAPARRLLRRTRASARKQALKDRQKQKRSLGKKRIRKWYLRRLQGSPASSLILCPTVLGRTSSDGAAGIRTPLVCPEHE